MATNTAQITIRKDTASNWTSSNPTPASGEFCLDTTNRKVVLGNGSTAHDSLPVTPDLFTKNGTDVASASTIDLDAATGDCVDVTGTTTITAITLAAGRRRLVRFTGALTLTNGASLVLPGGANITTVAGDVAEFRGYAASVVRCLWYSPLTRTGTGAIVHANTPTLTTPVIGAATGTSLAATGARLPDGRTVGRNLLLAWMGTPATEGGPGWVFRNARHQWTPYQQHGPAGAKRLTVKLGRYEDSKTGAEHGTVTVRITPKGAADLAHLLGVLPEPVAQHLEGASDAVA